MKNENATYIGIITKKAEDYFFVEFPSLPGCITYGNSLEEALQQAVDALYTYIECDDAPFELKYA